MLDVMVTFFVAMHSPIDGREAEDGWREQMEKKTELFSCGDRYMIKSREGQKIHFSGLGAGERAESHLAFSNKIHNIAVKAFFTFT